MFDSKSNPRTSDCLRILLLMLGVCVFAWGLKYKLSHYNRPAVQLHFAVRAKLLSQRERATAPTPSTFLESPTGPSVQRYWMNWLAGSQPLLIPFAAQPAQSRRASDSADAVPWFPIPKQSGLRTSVLFRPPPSLA